MLAETLQAKLGNRHAAVLLLHVRVCHLWSVLRSCVVLGCTAGAGDLPAFPVRFACDIMVGSGTLDGEKLMAGKHKRVCCIM
jgi:hypothetical protein